MFFIILGLVIVVLAYFARYCFGHYQLEFLGFFSSIAALVAALVFIACLFPYYSASYKADIINREYGTHYTREEIFWAGDVIDTIKEINRQRIEINGDVVTGK